MGIYAALRQRPPGLCQGDPFVFDAGSANFAVVQSGSQGHAFTQFRLNRLEHGWHHVCSKRHLSKMPEKQPDCLHVLNASGCRSKHGGQVNSAEEHLCSCPAVSVWAVCSSPVSSGALHRRLHVAQLLGRFPSGGQVLLCCGDGGDEVRAFLASGQMDLHDMPKVLQEFDGASDLWGL